MDRTVDACYNVKEDKETIRWFVWYLGKQIKSQDSNKIESLRSKVIHQPIL